MATEKAVILARGLGTRMRKQGPVGGGVLSDTVEALAQQGLKALIPLRGRPFLDYVVAGLRRAGLRRLCLVVAPDCPLLTDYARQTSERTGLDITCAVQGEPLGTADAVLAAESFAGGDPFIVCNGDNLYPDEALGRLAQLADRRCCIVGFERDALMQGSNFPPERLKAFAVLRAAPDGCLEEIIEKPPDPQRYARDGKLWVNMNLFRFTPEVFEACRQVRPSPRGELELTEAATRLARSGRVPFHVLFAEGPVLDLTGRDDVPALERLLEGREPGF